MGPSGDFADHPCMEYMPTSTPFNTPNMSYQPVVASQVVFHDPLFRKSTGFDTLQSLLVQIHVEVQ